MADRESPPRERRRRAKTLASRAAWVASALALALLAGGCTATSAPEGTEPSASQATLAPLLPPAASQADLSVDQGLAAALDEEFASDKYYAGLRSVIVLAQGRTVYERYFGSAATDYHQIYSVTKSVISTLIGIAISEGAISSVEATLAELLPDYAKDMTPAVARTTLDQLLTMMGGFTDEDPEPTATDWVADILGKQTDEPGEYWTYSSNSAHLASAILVEATGMPVLDYARAKLFDPLGIPSTPAAQPAPDDPDVDNAGFGWAADPQGINVGGYGLRLRAQDMAKIGLLYLNNGLWQGQQVVPADWTHTATTQHHDMGYDGGTYGYLWFALSKIDGDPAFQAMGYGGQVIRVIPARELVFVYQVWPDPEHPNPFTIPRIERTFTELIAPTYKT